MSRWFDILTRTTYVVDEPEVLEIQRHLASLLEDYLRTRVPAGEEGGDAARLKALADGVASFWADRYPKLIYPLRLTVNPAQPGGTFEAAGETPAPEVRGLSAPWRARFLQPGAPPLLPAGALGLPVPTTLLASEWALTGSAYALCALTLGNSQDVQPPAGDVLAALRLGILLFPVWNALEGAGEPLQALTSHPTVQAVAVHLSGRPAAGTPDAWRPVLDAIRTSEPPPDDQQGKVWLLEGSFYRIKQYVFESAKLAQIRGGSILLEQVVEKAARQVSRAFGPECVIRRAGGSLVALLPVERDEAARWEECITRLAYRATGAARFAASIAPVCPGALLGGEGDLFSGSHQVWESRRAEALEPLWEALPFEARCDRCGQRAAETDPKYQDETVLVCGVCRRREEVGRRERRCLIERAWQEVGEDPSAWVTPKTDEAGSSGDPVPPSLEELVPEGRRRRWIALVYGDGNNFGSLVQRMKGLAPYLHWTRRLYWTVRGLTELALVNAATFFAEPVSGGTAPDRAGLAGARARLTHYPFEVLTLGGDDVAFFAWAPVGLKAVEQLQAGLQYEFAPAPGGEDAGSGQDPALPPITFSFGVAIGDHHTPVRRLREIAEDVLLKKVKALRRVGDREGRIAFFVASNPGEMTPQRVRVLWRPEREKSNGGTTRLSLQPLTAREFAFLLEKALGLSHDMGRLSRLAAPFTRTDATVAALNYRYNAARARAGRDRGGEGASGAAAFFDLLEGQDQGGQGWSLFADTSLFPLLTPRTGAAGEEAPSGKDHLVPLLDLLQLAKAMQ